MAASVRSVERSMTGRLAHHSGRSQEDPWRQHDESRPRQHPGAQAAEAPGRARKLWDDLKGLMKISFKFTVKIAISISVTIVATGVALNNQAVNRLWNDLPMPHYLPAAVTELVDDIHGSSRLLLAEASKPPPSSVVVQGRGDRSHTWHVIVSPPPDFVHQAPESWCIQTKTIWASNPAFFPALPVELRENNCQQWGITAP